MKIGDVKIGETYASTDNPGRHSSDTALREVKALEIVTVEEPYWAGGSFTQERVTRNVRRVKIEVLDESTKSGYSYGRIVTSKRGDTLVVEAKQLVGAWSDIRPAILARVKEEQKKVALQTDLERRLHALGFKLSWGEVSVAVRNSERYEITFFGKQALKLLDMLEGSK